MDDFSGKKIFILYPDKQLRDKIFHGYLRDQFEIYYLSDHEKIRALMEFYPGSILCINLIKNDFSWLAKDVYEQLSDLEYEHKITMISLYEDLPPETDFWDASVCCHGESEIVIEDLRNTFTRFGGKGRRNFVRYGGYGETVAGIKVILPAMVAEGHVHDISALGLSCSLPDQSEIPVSDELLEIRLDLGAEHLYLKAMKNLERKITGRKIHVMIFDRNMDSENQRALYNFIHSSLDAGMNEFIKNLSD